MIIDELKIFPLQNPRDIAYTYSGYAPLSVRLAQYAARPSGWRGIEEVWSSKLNIASLQTVTSVGSG